MLASQQGTIHFVLRSGSDKGTPAAASMDMSKLMGVPTKTAVVERPTHVTGSISTIHVAPAQPAMPPVLAVETISGDKQTTDTFKVGGR